MQQNQVRSIVYTLQQNIRRVIVGKDEAIELALIALLCKGHVLIEDVPGVGKTTLVAALARSLSCSFKRIQFTPDVTPSDITGFTMPSLQTGEMEYKSGAVMSQIVLADEINRTSPKTQSSLLEVMGQDYIRTARAKGLSETKVIFKHALRNALIPVITVLGPTIANLLTGSFVVEQIFAIPGLGVHFVNSVSQRDYTTIMGVTVFYAAFLLAMVFLVDIFYCLIDPRIKYD